MAISQALAAAQARLDGMRAEYRRGTGYQVRSTEYGVPGTEWPVPPAPHSPIPDPRSLLPDPQSPIPLLPDLALAMLRSDRVAIGRLWWLLRVLDRAGRGALPLDVVRQQLTGRDAPLRLCGWRQLRQLLQAGNGLFWQRDREMVWLRGAARVAHALGVTRAQYGAVPVPVQALLGPIGAVRATLYATLHQSRPNAPIARATLQQISGVSPSSQRSYEVRVGIQAKAQYAIHFEQNSERLAWQHGRALFRVTDVRGDHGIIGRTVILRQLPNCYDAPAKGAPDKRKRTLNRRLAGLSQYGTTGNNGYAKWMRRYCTGAREAVAGGTGSVWRSLRPGLWYAYESGNTERRS